MAPQLQAPKSPFDCILFDLDDTLYPSETGIAPSIKKNIDEFLVIKYNLSPERASSLRVELFREYGSTLAGLIARGHNLHPDEYHSYVHGRLPYDQIVADPHLVHILDSIHQPKILFTNSDKNHVTTALAKLGIEEGYFSQIICFETMNPHLFAETKDKVSTEVILKPSPKALEVALRLAGFDPYRMLFLDDSERNVKMGKEVGLNTVLVGKRTKTKESDYAVDDIHNLMLDVPEIWGTPTNNKNRSIDTDLDNTIRTSTPIEA